jgi:hypothetical protein
VPSFYLEQSPGRLRSLPTTGSPWGSQSQHGGPPAALLARAVEQLGGTGGDADRVVGRFTLELFGPVPVGPLTVSASVLRPGRTVELCEAVLVDDTASRPCARAAAWLFPAGADGPGESGPPLSHGPADGEPHPRPEGWSGGYLDAVEWRWISGAVGEPGPAVVWMRPSVDLVEGESLTPVQRLLACVDSASGVSATLDPGRWLFLNTDLTVHLLRPPVGAWLCLDARTTLGPGNVGMAVSDVYDEQGLVARSAQALLTVRR